MLPPTRTVHVSLLGWEDPSLFHVYGVNTNVDKANGQLEANGDPGLNLVQVMNLWAYAEHDRNGGAGVCDCTTYTDRRTVDAQLAQFFPRPPFARRVTVYGAGVTATWVLHTNPFAAGPGLPSNVDTSVPGPSDGVLVSLPEGNPSIVTVVWGLQI